MCFSMEASFAAAAGLTIIGGFTLQRARTPGMRMLAATPLFFGLQQASEGLVWMTLNAGDTTSLLHKFSVYTFVFFAGSFWPFAVPAVLYHLESHAKRKKIIYSAMICGAIIALGGIAANLFFGITADNLSHHISYNTIGYDTSSSTALYVLYMALYAYATVGAMLASSLRFMWLVGAVTACSFVAAQVAYHTSFGSVWCFFAAVISGMVYLVAVKNNGKK